MSKRMNIYPIYGNTAPTYQVVLIRDCPFSTCIAPVMGSSLPDDISIARTLGLGEKPLLIFSWSALWPPALCGCTDTSPRKGSSPSVPSPSALLWALHPRCLAALPTRFSLPRDDIIAGQRDKKTSTRQINEVIASFEGWKQGEDIGETEGDKEEKEASLRMWYLSWVLKDVKKPEEPEEGHSRWRQEQVQRPWGQNAIGSSEAASLAGMGGAWKRSYAGYWWWGAGNCFLNSILKYF